MLDNKITFVETKTDWVYKPVFGSYSFREDRPYHRLQRALLWGLDKLGCLAFDRVAQYRSYEVNLKSVFKQALRVQQFLLQQDYPVDDGVVLFMGPMEENLLRGDPNLQGHFGFFIEPGRTRNQLLGMDVHIIPYMRGILAVPKAWLEDVYFPPR